MTVTPIIKLLCSVSGVTRDVSGANVSAAKTKSGRRTWTQTAEKTTAQTSAATTATAFAAPASARSGRILQKFTAASTASATTSTATAPTTSSAEVRAARVKRFESAIDLTLR